MARLFDDASNQYLLNNNAVLTAVPITMTCWFRTDDLTKPQHLVSIGVSGSGENWFHLDFRGDFAGDTVIAATKTTGVSYAETTSGASVNTWHHACGVFAAINDRRAFIDGGSKGTNAVSRTPSAGNMTTIGEEALQGGTEEMSGRIAEVGIWNVALSDAEVAALARGVSLQRIRPASLVAYWPLYGVGSPEPDYRGGFHMTLTAGPTAADHAPVFTGFGFDFGALPVAVSAPAARTTKNTDPYGLGIAAGISRTVKVGVGM